MAWTLVGTIPGTGGSGVPGSATIFEASNSLEANATYAETNPVAGETSSLEAAVEYAEANTLPTHTDDFQAFIDSETEQLQTAVADLLEILFPAEPNPTPTEAHTQALEATSATEANTVPADAFGTLDLTAANEPNTTPTEAQTAEVAPTVEANTTPGETNLSELAASSSEANTSPTEVNALNIGAANEPNMAPTAGHTSATTAGATTVTQTTGTGWVNPANAQNLSNGTNATITGPSGLTPTAITGTLVGSYATLGTLATETQDAASVTLTFTTTTVLSSPLGEVYVEYSYSTNSGTTYTLIGNPIIATSSAPVTASVTLAATSLSTLRFKVAASVKGDAVAASSATLDAVVISFNHTGSAG